MKVKINTILKRLNGEPLKNPNGSEFSLKDACVNVLVADSANPNEKEEGKTKYDRYNLAKKIDKCKVGTADLTAEEISMLKDLIGLHYGPLIVGRAYDVFEGIEDEPEKPEVVKEPVSKTSKETAKQTRKATEKASV